MDVDAEVLAVSAAWDAAPISNDASALAGFVTDDWVYVGQAGATARVDIVDWIASGTLVHHTMQTIGAPRVAVHGATALVTARKASSGAWEGVEYTADEWITEIFVRVAGRWRCVLSQKSPVDA